MDGAFSNSIFIRAREAVCAVEGYILATFKPSGRCELHSLFLSVTIQPHTGKYSM